MNDPKKGTMTALVCPPGVWDLLRGVLMSQSAASSQALARVLHSETNHPMFAFRAHSITVDSLEAMSQIVGRLASKGEALVCIIPLPEDTDEICVREDQARMLDETARAAGQHEQLPAPHPACAPDEHLQGDYEDRVSGAGDRLE
jgi:hypothetical protein